MRIVRLKLDAKVKQFLKGTARTFAIKDSGFVEDIFALLRLKGNGLPSKERIDKMSKTAAKRRKGAVTEQAVNMLISKRKMMFVKMLGLPYFHALCALGDPIEATNRFITRMNVLHTKVRQSQCVTCSLINDCDFGKQYGPIMKDISRVIDPDYKKKAHPKCPHMPEIDGMNQFYQSLVAFLSMMSQMGSPEQEVAEQQNRQEEKAANFEDIEEMQEEFDESGFAPREDTELQTVTGDPEDEEEPFHVPGMTGEPSGVYDGKHDSNALCRVPEKLIDTVTVKQLVIFDLGKKFSNELVKEKLGKFKPVTNIEEDKQGAKIERVSDISKLTASQHGLPAEVFDARLEKKTLIKQEHLKREEKKKRLYILTDNSGSMNSQIGNDAKGGRLSPSGLYTRGSLATLFSLAIVRRVRDDGGLVFHRFFAGGVSPLKAAETKAEYEAMLEWILTASYSYGSTDIPLAIRTAGNDFHAERQKFKDSEILLITDCEDGLDAAIAKTSLQGFELNVLDVAGNGEAAHTELKAIATKYYKANETVADVSKMVDLL